MVRDRVVSSCEEEHTGDVVVDTADDRTAETGRQDVFLDLEKDLCLSSCFFGLQDVHVHFVTVEVGVVRRTDGRVHPESLSREDLDIVRHDTHLVQRRLSVEENDIAVAQVPFDDPSVFDLLAEVFGIDVGDLDTAAVRTDHIVGARIVLAVHDVVPEEFDVARRGCFRDRQDLGDRQRHADFIDTQVGFRRDDRTGGEIDTFTGERSSETAFFSFQTLGERFERSSGSVTGRRDA